MSDPLLAEILAAVNAVRADLASHMHDEENELVEIRENAQRNREESEKRHAALLEAIKGYMAKQNEIEHAFLKNEEGAPDFSGHHTDHDERRSFARWRAKIRDGAVAKLVELGAVGFVVWLVFTLWDAFLKGPKP